MGTPDGVNLYSTLHFTEEWGSEHLKLNCSVWPQPQAGGSVQDPSTIPETVLSTKVLSAYFYVLFCMFQTQPFMQPRLLSLSRNYSYVFLCLEIPVVTCLKSTSFLSTVKTTRDFNSRYLLSEMKLLAFKLGTMVHAFNPITWGLGRGAEMSRALSLKPAWSTK